MGCENDSIYMGVYSDVAEIIGEDKVADFYKRFKGQQVVFPMRLYSQAYVVSKAKEAKGKCPMAVVAKKYEYSERYLRKLVAENSILVICQD